MSNVTRGFEPGICGPENRKVLSAALTISARCSDMKIANVKNIFLRNTVGALLYDVFGVQYKSYVEVWIQATFNGMFSIFK